MENTKLVELTRTLINLKRDKKDTIKEMNDQIKDTEAAIKGLVKEKGE